MSLLDEQAQRDILNRSADQQREVDSLSVMNAALRERLLAAGARITALDARCAQLVEACQAVTTDAAEGQTTQDFERALAKVEAALTPDVTQAAAAWEERIRAEERAAALAMVETYRAGAVAPYVEALDWVRAQRDEERTKHEAEIAQLKEELRLSEEFDKDMEEYAGRIRAEEREACAKDLEVEAARLHALPHPQSAVVVGAIAVALGKRAAAIRARGLAQDRPDGDGK